MFDKLFITILCGALIIVSAMFLNVHSQRDEYKQKYERATGVLDAHESSEYINLSLYYNNQETQQDVLLRKWYLPKKELDNRLNLWWLWEVKQMRIGDRQRHWREIHNGDTRKNTE